LDIITKWDHQTKEEAFAATLLFPIELDSLQQEFHYPNLKEKYGNDPFD